MSSRRIRKPPQHDIEAISRNQLTEILSRHRWAVGPVTPDYGEDLLVRIFEAGNNTGHDFYLQLKGTEDITKYKLKSGDFRYSVEVVTLKHWRRNIVPTVLVLWDIEQRTGYWLHVQPFIERAMQEKPTWLDDERAERTIRVPATQVLDTVGLAHLRRAIALAMQHLERDQRQGTQDIDRELTEGIPSPDDLAVVLPESARRKFQQQVEIARIEATITTDPTNPEPWMALASLYYDTEDFENALAAINRARDMQPGKNQTLWMRASILAEYAASHGKRPKSMLLEALRTFIRLRPTLSFASDADYNIGNTLMYLEKYHEAVASFDRALAGDSPPKRASEIWKNRGTCFFHLGDHEEEFRSYQKALDLYPDRWEAYSSWAVTDMRLGNYEHAKDMLYRAAQINSNLGTQNPSHMYWLALCCWKLGEIAEAYRGVNHVLNIAPEHRQAWMLKARLLSTLWRSDDTYAPAAIGFFRARIIDQPDDMFAHRELYLILNSQDKKDDARLIAAFASPAPDTSAQSLFHYAAILEDEGRTNDAIRYLEAALDKSHDHNIIHKLAMLKEKSEQYQEAIDLYMMIADEEPAHVLPSLADCHYRLGNHLEALRYCAKLALRDPDNIAYWKNMAHAARKLSIWPVVILCIAISRVPPLGETDVGSWREQKIEMLIDALRAEFGDELLK